MLRNFIRLPWFMRKKIEPKIYRIFCLKCDYAETVEMENPGVSTYHNPDCDSANDPRIVSKLPKICPICGAKLKNERIPVILQY